MKSIQAWLDDYSVSHRNPVNKKLHWTCVPPIVLSAFGMLRALPFGDAAINGASIAAVLVLIYYTLLSWRLTLGMVGIFALLYFIADYSFTHLATHVHLGLMIAIFVVAWIGQFVGHKIEGAKPSFFKDLQFLLIGPLWLLADLYRHMRLEIDDRRVVHG